MKFAIYGSKRQEAFLPLIEQFLNMLVERSHHVVMHSKLYNYLSGLIPLSPAVKEFKEGDELEADVVVSIGGDGSFLRAAAWVGHREIPIVGVNTGHLGFLASCDIHDLEAMVDNLSEGNYRVRSHSLIEVVEPAVNGWPYALNEVTVTKGDGASIVNVAAKIDGISLANYRADGLIISTPTGSTAYNLSVGGPIVEPSAPVFVLSPIAAHSLTLRPLVINDSSVITMECESRFPTFRITVDGRAADFPVGTRVVLERARFDVKAIELPGRNFALTLRQKMGWGD